jgi:hypothetical protein
LPVPNRRTCAISTSARAIRSRSGIEKPALIPQHLGISLSHTAAVPISMARHLGGFERGDRDGNCTQLHLYSHLIFLRQRPKFRAPPGSFRADAPKTGGRGVGLESDALLAAQNRIRARCEDASTPLSNFKRKAPPFARRNRTHHRRDQAGARPAEEASLTGTMPSVASMS